MAGNGSSRRGEGWSLQACRAFAGPARGVALVQPDLLDVPDFIDRTQSSIEASLNGRIFGASRWTIFGPPSIRRCASAKPFPGRRGAKEVLKGNRGLPNPRFARAREEADEISTCEDRGCGALTEEF